MFRTHWTAGEPPEIHHMDRTTAYEAAKLGMWLFLATEVLLFGGLFAAYVIYHWMYPAEFHAASHHLNRTIGLVNTIVLLASSLTAALAVDAAQHSNNKKVSLYLVLTLIGAAIFLGIKSYEWHHKWTDGLFPGSVSPDGVAFNSEQFSEAYKMFYGLYYCMTGLHAIHVILGAGYLAWLLYYSMKNRWSAKYYTPVEIGALYWHLVDLIWIYLFPLLYLIG
jgi:cytochrome c oxidase subunit 3